jgi:hypothetical protein
MSVRISRLLLSAIGLSTFLLATVPSWAGTLPIKRPSDYGQSNGQVQLTTPAFAPITQDGVNITLDSVFCSVNDCGGGGGDPTGQSITYFFAINLAAGSQITSLTFGPGFDLGDFGYTGIEFDSTFTCDPSRTCAPSSDIGVSFAAVQSTVDCSTGSCAVSFLNFDAATLGTGKIIFAASTPDSSPLNLGNGLAQTPLLTANTSGTVSVPEPNGLWFLGIAGFVCMAGIARRRRTFLSGTNA